MEEEVLVEEEPVEPLGEAPLEEVIVEEPVIEEPPPEEVIDYTEQIEVLTQKVDELIESNNVVNDNLSGILLNVMDIVELNLPDISYKLSEISTMFFYSLTTFFVLFFSWMIYWLIKPVFKI